jgi:hypothetical protein
MFGSKEVKKPKPEVSPNFTQEDREKTKQYLLKQIRDYLEMGEDPEYTEMICRCIDALAKLKDIT